VSDRKRNAVIFCPDNTTLSPYRLVDTNGEEVEPICTFLDATALRGLSQATLRTYAFALKSAWQWMIEQGLTLEELTQPYCLDFIRFARARPRGSLAPRSINLWLVVLRRLYEFHTGNSLPNGRRQHDESAFPFYRLTSAGWASPVRRRPNLRVKVPYRLVVPLTRRELARFFASLQTSRDLAIASLMLFCGLRSREVIDLELQDIQRDSDQIRVRGKGDKDRILPLAPEAHSSLRRYLRRERPGNLKHDRAFVVLKGRRRGEPMTPAGLRSLFRHHRRRAAAPRANPHRFRHTFAVDMVRAGMSLPALMRLMGHSRIEMTLRYVNLSADDVREELLAALRQRDRQETDE
jgi:site-specific recombinase XerD